MPSCMSQWVWSPEVSHTAFTSWAWPRERERRVEGRRWRREAVWKVEGEICGSGAQCSSMATRSKQTTPNPVRMQLMEKVEEERAEEERAEEVEEEGVEEGVEEGRKRERRRRRGRKRERRRRRRGRKR